MVTRVVPIVVIVLSLLSAAVSEAQEKGQSGLTMGYPGSIGFLWHPTDRVGIRPEIAFGLSSTDSSNSFRVTAGIWDSASAGSSI